MIAQVVARQRKRGSSQKKADKALGARRFRAHNRKPLGQTHT